MTQKGGEVGASDTHSDINENIDFSNFKGIHYHDTTEKYIDPVTGCHFKYDDLCRRLNIQKKRRKMLDKHLGLKTTSMLPSERDADEDPTQAEDAKHSNESKSDDNNRNLGLKGRNQAENSDSKNGPTAPINDADAQRIRDQSSLLKSGQS